MRTLSLCALLLLAAAAVAADTPGDTPAAKTQPQWQAFRAPDGSFQFRTKPDSARITRGDKIPKEAVDQFLNANTCYFIRSYVMHRDDDTEAMHLERVTTCTPKSRVRMKSTVRVVPADR